MLTRLTLMQLAIGALALRVVRLYIDPNTGGMLFQVLGVGFTFLSGVLFFFSRQIRTAVARIQRLFRRQG